MPVFLQAFLSVFATTLGKMAIKYLMNSEAIEAITMFAVEKLVEATDSLIDDEVLAKLKEKAK